MTGLRSKAILDRAGQTALVRPPREVVARAGQTQQSWSDRRAGQTQQRGCGPRWSDRPERLWPALVRPNRAGQTAALVRPNREVCGPRWSDRPERLWPALVRPNRAGQTAALVRPNREVVARAGQTAALVRPNREVVARAGQTAQRGCGPRWSDRAGQTALVRPNRAGQTAALVRPRWSDRAGQTAQRGCGPRWSDPTERLWPALVRPPRWSDPTERLWPALVRPPREVVARAGQTALVRPRWSDPTELVRPPRWSDRAGQTALVRPPREVVARAGQTQQSCQAMNTALQSDISAFLSTGYDAARPRKQHKSIARAEIAVTGCYKGPNY
jgi:hypothetical protein